MNMTPDGEAHPTLTSVSVPVGTHALHGDLGVPPMPQGLVLFVNASDSQNARHQFVARELRRDGLATLLIDLLTLEEDAVDEDTGEFRFDTDLLSQRVVTIVDWLGERGGTAALPIGLFGAGTGVGAVLAAAAARPDDVRAVVSRGGRPDLAGDALTVVRAPTLLIVGGDDEQAIEMNQEAMRRMPGRVHLEIVSGATHLFEEPGALEQVAELAADWFVDAFTIEAFQPPVDRPVVRH